MLLVDTTDGARWSSPPPHLAFTINPTNIDHPSPDPKPRYQIHLPTKKPPTKFHEQVLKVVSQPNEAIWCSPELVASEIAGLARSDRRIHPCLRTASSILGLEAIHRISSGLGNLVADEIR